MVFATRQTRSKTQWRRRPGSGVVSKAGVWLCEFQYRFVWQCDAYGEIRNRSTKFETNPNTKIFEIRYLKI